MKKLAIVMTAVLLLVGCSEDKRLFNKAKLATSEGKYEQAIGFYTRILKRNPTHYAALLNRGVLWERLPVKDMQERAKNRQNAEQDYLKALEVNPKSAETYNNLGALYIDKKQNLEAISYFTQAIQLSPRYFTALMNRGIANYNLGRSMAALEDFNKAEKVRKNDPLLLLNRGLVNFDMGQYESAVDDYTRLIEVDPDNARAYLERARALIRMEYPANAYADLEEAVTIKPTYALAYYYMGDVMFRRGEKDYALGLLVKSKELADQYAPTYELMGDMLSVEDPVSATANYMVAKKLDPQHVARYEAKIRLMRTEEGRERVFANRFYQR